MKASAFREIVTAVDMLDAQGFGTRTLDFVAEFGLISVATADFPDNPFVQQAAQIYGGKHYGWGYGSGSGSELGNGTGCGSAYGNAATGRDTECDGGSNTFDFSKGRSLQNGYGGNFGDGDGVGFGIGRDYGNGYHDGDGWGGGNCYGHQYGEDYIPRWSTPHEWDAACASDTPANPSNANPEIQEAQAACLLDAARVPASHRAAFAHALCAGVPVDPGLILWLSPPSRARRWRGVLEAFAASNKNVDSASIRANAYALLDRAEATRIWPRRAISSLRSLGTDSGSFDPATFPPLPSSLQPWRDALQSIAIETRALLYDAFAKPADVTWSDQVCSIVVLGCFRLRFDFEARDIHLDERNASGWVQVPGACASLLQPLPTEVWCQDFALTLRERVRTTLGPSWTKGVIRNSCVAWLTDVVKQSAAKSDLIEHVRDLLRLAYPCNEQIVLDALACRMDPDGLASLTTHQYVAAWRDSEILRIRVAEVPQLAPVWALARDAGCLEATDDYDALRSLFQRWGVTPAGWRLLVRHGRPLYQPLTDIPQNAKQMLRTLARYLCILQRAQCREPIPAPLVKALFGQHWFSNNLDYDTLPPGLIRGAIERFGIATSSSAKHHFVEQEFVSVLGWIARTAPTFDKNQWCASWTWFFMRYQQWNKTERRKRVGRRWETGIDGLRWRDFCVTPIRDSVTLWHEGEQMRMCLNQFETDCAEGRYIVYAVRAADRARSIAHIGLELKKSGRFELDQVHGFANSTVESALKAYAEKLPEIHRAQIEAKGETHPVRKAQ